MISEQVTSSPPQAGTKGCQQAGYWRSLLLLPLLLIALACATSSAMAGSPLDVAQVSQGEFALLPPYCPFTAAYRGMRPDPERQYEHWKSLLGETFPHLHHYCWGVLKAMRAEMVGVEPQMRRTLFDSAIQECRYVVDRAPANFVLLPEIFLRMGQYSAALERPIDALEYFEQSRGTKVDYWPAYMEIAKVNLGLGRRKQAVDALKAGVEATGGEQRLVDELQRVEALPPASSRRGGQSASQ